MERAVRAASGVRFGSFEVDLRSGELRKGGLRVKLTGQAFQVLAILLERPGEMVTREELQKRLWSSDTFVDFDHGLNNAVNRIREALGDTKESPRFVETLPRRGYRFIGPVDVGGDLGSVQQRGPQSVPLRQQPQNDGVAAVQEPSLKRYWLLGSSSVAIIIAAILSYWLTRPLMPPKVSSYTRITNDGRAKSFRTNAFPVIVTDGLRVYFAETANSGMRWLGFKR